MRRRSSRGTSRRPGGTHCDGPPRHGAWAKRCVDCGFRWVSLSRLESSSSRDGVVSKYRSVRFCCGKEVCVLKMCLTFDTAMAGRPCQVSQNGPGACSPRVIGCRRPAPAARPEALAGGWAGATWVGHAPRLLSFHEQQQARPLKCRPCPGLPCAAAAGRCSICSIHIRLFGLMSSRLKREIVSPQPSRPTAPASPAPVPGPPQALGPGPQHQGTGTLRQRQGRRGRPAAPRLLTSRHAANWEWRAGRVVGAQQQHSRAQQSRHQRHSSFDSIQA